MKNRISSIMGIRKKKTGIIITCVLILSIMVGGWVFASQAQAQSNDVPTQLSSFETTEYECLQDLSEPLQKLGLMFIDGSVLPHIPNSLNEENPHIGRSSQNTPISISSEADVDLLLQAIRLCTAAVLSWDTGVDDAIAEAGLEDYFRSGFREITRPYREQAIIDMATNYSFSELVERVFSQRPEMLAEFQTLGFFQGYKLDNSAQRTRSYGCIFGDVIVLDDGLFVDANGVIREK